MRSRALRYFAVPRQIDIRQGQGDTKWIFDILEPTLLASHIRFRQCEVEPCRSLQILSVSTSVLNGQPGFTIPGYNAQLDYVSWRRDGSGDLQCGENRLKCSVHI